MSGIIQIIAVITSTVIFIAVIELIRRNHLKERYSLIWLATASVLLLFSLWRPLLHSMARALGIYYPPSLLFLLAIAFLIALLLHFSTVISSLSERNKRLAQEVGMLKEKVEGIEKKMKPDR